MAKFNIKDYATVEERINEFRTVNSDARIETELLHYSEENKVVIRASVFLNGDDQKHRCPVGVGIAEETPEGYVNETSRVENCDTSAVGRALANAGYPGKRGAPRPSREEMEKVDRLQQKPKKEAEPKKELITDNGDPIADEINAFTESDKLVEWFTKTMNEQENPDKFKSKYLPIAQSKMDELG